MKLGTKFLVTLSATALALVGWAVPAAVATGGGGSSDNKNTADYWLNQYDNAVACYYSEGDSGHGEVTDDAEGNEGVKLKEFVQSWEGDRWEVLIVKGGNDRNVYELPNANEVYHAPDNASGKPAGVSHWIVCKGSQEQQTFQPDCASMTFEYPGSTKDQHINVEIKPRGADAGESNITLNFHNDDDSWSNPYTAVYADHPNWPGWAEYTVVWVQVSGQDYHWSGALDCGEPDPEYFICEWNSETDEFTKTKVESIGAEDVEWVDGSECTPDEATYCFADGDGGFTEDTVRDDGTYPLGDPVDAENCIEDEVEYEICVWNSDTDTAVKTTVPAMTGDDIEWVDGSECTPDEATYCFADGDGGFTEATVRDDGTYPLGDPVDAENCIEDEVEYEICVWNSDTDTAVKTTVPAMTGDDIEWVDGSECTPDEATYCFADGDGGFTEATVRDDGTYPLGDPVDAENCIEDEVEYEICVWNSDTDTAVKTTVPAMTGDDIEWVDGSECTPDEATYCFADGDGGFTEATVRDDGTYPLGDPVDAENCVEDEVEYTICAEGDNGWYGMTVTEDELPAEYTLWTGDAADCFEEYTTFFCWEIQGEDLQTDQWGHPLFNGDLFTPPQEFVMEGDSFTDLRDCWDIVADCDTITWFQLDEYIVKSEQDEAYLEYLKANGNGWNGESAHDAYMVVDWVFQSAVGDECEEPTPEYICEWNAETDTPVRTEVAEIGEGDIEWVDGSECTPDEATYCFADGDGGFVQDTVRDDGTYPLGDPVDAENCVEDEVEYTICAQDGDTWYGLTVTEDELPAEYILWTGDAADCYDEPLYICLWDDEQDTPVMTEVDSISPTQTPWFDGSECTPDEATYCFADGDGGFVQDTVRDDGNFPLGDPVASEDCVESVNDVTICAQDGDTWYGLTVTEDELPAEYILWTGDASDCFEDEEEITYVEVCVEGDEEGTFEAGTIPESELTEDMLLWDAEMEDGGCSEDFTVVLGAPPLEAPAATPIVAVATYAG
ncbi:hypothetical protein ACNI3K_01050 [Demequina sp. SO4-13]|uniref:hypothetical protein n=1 Tax=Demequina sp. SO4-13 TaxID=3401027 RepID=UPI003AF49220